MLQEIERLKAQCNYQQRILAQIEARQDKKSRERQELLDEGRRIRERLAQVQWGEAQVGAGHSCSRESLLHAR